MNSKNNSILEELRNTVIRGDCLEVMKKLPDNCIDLVLTDPPYGVEELTGKEFSHGRGKLKSRAFNMGNKKIKKWDKSPLEEYFDEIFRISKNQIIWGANYFELSKYRCVLVWDKCQPFPNFSAVEIAYSSHNEPAKIFKLDNRYSGKVHPTQKPVELMVWCLENYLLKNWKEDRRPIVFDGFAGSGTTGVACKKCGCDFILVEQDKDYVEICKKRLAQETLF